VNGEVFSDFLAKLNAGAGFARRTDWRLPTSAGGGSTGQPAELESTVDTNASGCGSGSPSSPTTCINAIFGPTAWFLYWSSSSAEAADGATWAVNFRDGTLDGSSGRTTRLSVRAVRGGP
jgi:hypothetical protein